MQSFVVQEFGRLGVTLTDAHVVEMTRLVIGFETRGSHVMALNSQTLAVHRAVFTDGDRAAVFQLVGLTEDQVKAAVRQIPTIDPNHKVASDAFNLLSVWLLHLAAVQLRNPTARHGFQMAVAKYLHYRFFTSLVGNFFRHGAREDTMLATINRLSRKYDIVTAGTWKKAIALRCEDLLGPQSIHHATIQTASPDQKVTYLLTDTQTRMRDRIKHIADVYYTTKADGVGVAERASVVEIDGEKVLTQSTSTFDAMVSTMTVELMNSRAFVDRTVAGYIARQFSAVSPSLLITVLTAMADLAQSQAQSKALDQEILVEGTKVGLATQDQVKVYAGMRALVTNVIHASFRYCLKNNIPFDNRAELMIRIKNIYASSRITDDNINKVKASLVHFVDQLGVTSRDSTKSSLRLAIALYIVVRSFRRL